MRPVRFLTLFGMTGILEREAVPPVSRAKVIANACRAYRYRRFQSRTYTLPGAPLHLLAARHSETLRKASIPGKDDHACNLLFSPKASDVTCPRVSRLSALKGLTQIAQGIALGNWYKCPREP